MSWEEQEMVGADPGDARRSRRLVRLAEQPRANIPAACIAAAKIKAAYRLLSHDAVAWYDILEPISKTACSA